MSEEVGKHFDSDKLRVDLVPLELIEGVARVLGYGAKKYGDHNWEKGIAWMRIYGSALRHLFQWRRGIDIDPESGLPHLEHAACNIAFLLEYAKTRKEFDNRGGKEEEPSLGQLRKAEYLKACPSSPAPIPTPTTERMIGY